MAICQSSFQFWCWTNKIMVSANNEIRDYQTKYNKFSAHGTNKKPRDSGKMMKSVDFSLETEIMR